MGLKWYSQIKTISSVGIAMTTGLTHIFHKSKILQSQNLILQACAFQNVLRQVLSRCDKKT